MRIIICGAGMVGYSIAQQLSKEDNEVTVIDYDAELIARINDRLDVTAIHGHASHPAVLKAARAEDADMLIAVTYSDDGRLSDRLFAVQHSHAYRPHPSSGLPQARLGGAVFQ
jgi:Trk K+ transport system NAD-binding subunit